jgi:nicotinate-nucleotide pyrophosphorylase (carboxylating)
LLKIEVEAQNAAEVEQALSAGADVIMLDNMGVEEVAAAVRAVAGRCELEVSGGVDLESVRAFAECGVDCISVGALTHSAPAFDFSLEIVGG